MLRQCTQALHTWRVSLSVDMLLSAVSVLVIVLQSPEIPEGLMNNPVYIAHMFISMLLSSSIFFTSSHLLIPK
jgi:hypothetical protein